MGQCSSENSCSEDLCRRSRRPPAPLAKHDDSALAGEESTPSPAAELPSELAGAVAKAVEASQAERSLATLSVPKCKSKGVQTEPVTPETEVLPETFFVPDGEPWELAPSTEGSEHISEIDFRADPALGLSGVDACHSRLWGGRYSGVQPEVGRTIDGPPGIQNIQTPPVGQVETIWETLKIALLNGTDQRVPRPRRIESALPIEKPSAPLPKVTDSLLPSGFHCLHHCGSQLSW